MYEAMFDSAAWSLPKVVAAQALNRGDHPFIRDVNGGSLSFRETHEDACRVAGYLHSLGVEPGDRVIVMMANSLDFIRIWTGLGRLGAIMVGLNTALTGPILESQVMRSKARVALVGSHFLPVFAEILPQTPDLAKLIVAGEPGDFASPETVTLADFAKWQNAEPYDGPMPDCSDIACIFYTSGTTGPSKGVLLPHAHCYLYGLGTVDNCAMTPEDRFYDVLPFFHVNGLFIQVYACLIAGATLVMRERFSASAWLDDIITFEATITVVVGAVISFVIGQPASPRDTQHKLRVLLPGPNLPEHERIWRERFGVPEVVGSYGMTECNIPTWCRIGDTRPGSIGKAYAPYFDVQVADPDTDRILPPDTVGEIVVRPNTPFGFMAGYDGMPEKTVGATRNLWFHTGDAGRMDKDGFIYFIDRMNDRIRRRGENISSYEVEEALERMAKVKEVAAFAVPSGLGDGEDELMVAVAPVAGESLAAEEIASFAAAILPKFARPRYIEIVDALPRTKTEKVRKIALRERGISSMTYDVQLALFID
ncbi:AMP-binding protein [Hoeflea sp.]|uniref:AMP-binding protein n=1 Tax=Hoeflea sp. TaxID=1940281 RepID=UPI003A920EC7